MRSFGSATHLLAVAILGFLLTITLSGCCLLCNRLGSNFSSEPQGLYVGTEAGNQPNWQGGYNYAVSNYYYMFLTGGRYCYGLPRGGMLDDFDVANAERANVKCGTYKIVADQIQLYMPGLETQRYKFASHGKTFEMAGTTYYRVTPADGLRLDGAYSNSRYTNKSSSVSNGGVSGESFIRFSRDGKFTEKGFTGFTSSTGGVAATGSRSTSGSGTYTIHGNTLEALYSDGNRKRATFFVDPQLTGESYPEVIWIDGGAYRLAK